MDEGIEMMQIKKTSFDRDPLGGLKKIRLVRI